jgi:ABC-2 type transport system permease protein
MTAFLAMLRKELRVVYRNPAALVLLVIMPFLLIAIMSKAFEPLFEGRESFDIPLVDLDRTPESQALTQSLEDLDGLDVRVLEWERETFDESDAAGIVDDADDFAVLVIPRGFAASAVAGDGATIVMYAEPAQKGFSGLLEEQVQSRLLIEDLLRTFQTALAEETGDPGAAQDTVDHEIRPIVAEPSLTLERVFTSKRDALPSNFEQTVPGFSVMFTFWLSLFIAASIYGEKREHRTWRRALVAPVSRANILLSRTVAYVLIGVLQMTALFVLGRIFFGLNLGDEPWALLAVFAATALVTTAFGIFMAAMITDFATLNSVVNLVVIVLAAVGGALIPLFLLPDWLQPFSRLTPQYWAMDASQRLILVGDGFVDVLPQIGVLLVFAVVFFTLGLLRFRFND